MRHAYYFHLQMYLVNSFLNRNIKQIKSQSHVNLYYKRFCIMSELKTPTPSQFYSLFSILPDLLKSIYALHIIPIFASLHITKTKLHTLVTDLTFRMCGRLAGHSLIHCNGCTTHCFGCTVFLQPVLCWWTYGCISSFFC